MPSRSTFDPVFQVGLPLPLACLYAQAHHAKGDRERHDYAFQLVESSLKLAASALIARYRACGRRSVKVDAALSHLTLPSLGQWVAMFKETLLFLGRPPGTDPWARKILDRLGTVKEGREGIQLGAVFASMAKAMSYGGRASARIKALDLLDLLPAYRNVMSDAHGGIKADLSLYEKSTPALLALAHVLLEEGDILGGGRLLYSEEVKVGLRGEERVVWMDLTGPTPMRRHPQDGQETREKILPGRLFLEIGRDEHLSLHPFLFYQQDGPLAQVFYLNRAREGKSGIQFLSYTTGEFYLPGRDPVGDFLVGELKEVLAWVNRGKDGAEAPENLGSEVSKGTGRPSDRTGAAPPPVTIRCPRCNATYRIQGSKHGAVSARCVKCGNSFSAVIPTGMPSSSAAFASSQVHPPAAIGARASTSRPRSVLGRSDQKTGGKDSLKALYIGLGIGAAAVALVAIAVIAFSGRSGSPPILEAPVSTAPVPPPSPIAADTRHPPQPEGEIPSLPPKIILDRLAQANGLARISPQDMKEVKGRLVELDLMGNEGLRRLDPLRGTPLRRLVLARTNVEDLSPIKDLPLEELNIGRTKVKDLSPIKDLPLEMLFLTDTPVEDLTPLRGKKLTKIEFEPAFVKHGIEALRDMPALQEINGQSPQDFWAAYDLHIALREANPDYRFEGDFRSRSGEVEDVRLMASNIKDLNPLLRQRSLRKLSLYKVPVSDLSPLRRLDLESLKLNMLSLKSLEVVAGMKLKELDLAGNEGLSDLSPLSGMPVASLVLSDTAVEDLSALKDLPRLIYLDLSGTRVTQLSPLRETNVAVLWLDRTPVKDLSPLRGMRLIAISFDHKEMPQGLSVLREMPSLQAIGPRPTYLFAAGPYWQLVSGKEKVEPSLPKIFEKLPELVKPEAAGRKYSAAEVFERASQAVVLVETRRGSRKGFGSGVCVGQAGLILTNLHIIVDAEDIQVVPFICSKGSAVRMPSVKAKKIFESPIDDIAALRLDPVPIYMSPLPVAASNPPTGGKVYAIGNPGLGEKVLEQSITEGIISSNHREHEGAIWLQHSAPVNPGNSGGPLIDDCCQVVGIVTLKYHLEGVSLAIPAEKIRDLFERHSR